MLNPSAAARAQGIQWTRPHLGEMCGAIRNAIEGLVGESGSDRPSLDQARAIARQLAYTLDALDIGGAARLGHALASALDSVDESLNEADATVLLEAVAVLPDYLERLETGAPDTPEVLADRINALHAIAGQEPDAPTSIIPLDALEPGFAPDPDAPSVDALRRAWQRALRDWLVNPEQTGDLVQVAEHLQSVEAAPLRRLGVAAAAVFSALGARHLQPDPDLNRRLAGIDNLLRQWAETPDSSKLADEADRTTEALAEQLLTAKPGLDSVDRLRERLGESDYMAELARARSVLSGRNRQLFTAVAEAARGELNLAKDALNATLLGKSEDRPGIDEQTRLLQSVSESLGMLGLNRLADRVLGQAERLGELTGDPESPILLDVARELLLVDSELEESVLFLGEAPASSLLEGDGQNLPKAEHRRVMRQILAETLDDLGQAKHLLDQLYRGQAEPGAASQAAETLDRLAGVLHMAELDQAAGLIEASARSVRDELVDADPAGADRDRLGALAEALVVTEFYLDSLTRLDDRGQQYLDSARSHLVELGYLGETVTPSDAEDAAEEAGQTEPLSFDRDDDEADTPGEPPREARLGSSGDDLSGDPLGDTPGEPFEEPSGETGDEPVETATSGRDKDADAGFDYEGFDFAEFTSGEDKTSSADTSEEPPPATIDPDSGSGLELELESDDDFDFGAELETDAEASPETDAEAGIEKDAGAGLEDDSGVEGGVELEDETGLGAELEDQADDERKAGFEAELEDEASLEPHASTEPSAGTESGMAGGALDGDDFDLMSIFLEEFDEELAALQQRLPRWREEPENREVIGDIRRSFHTLKGSGRMAGADRIGEFAWAFEQILNQALDGQFPPADIVDLVGEAVDTLPGLRNALTGDSTETHEAEVDALIHRARSIGGERPLPELDGLDETLVQLMIKEIGDHLESVDRWINESRQRGWAQPIHRDLIRSVHTIKGTLRLAPVGDEAESMQVVEEYLQEVHDTDSTPDEQAVDLVEDMRTMLGKRLERLNQQAVSTSHFQTAHLAEQARGLISGLHRRRADSDEEELTPTAGWRGAEVIDLEDEARDESEADFAEAAEGDEPAEQRGTEPEAETEAPTEAEADSEPAAEAEGRTEAEVEDETGTQTDVLETTEPSTETSDEADEDTVASGQDSDGVLIGIDEADETVEFPEDEVPGVAADGVDKPERIDEIDARTSSDVDTDGDETGIETEADPETEPESVADAEDEAGVEHETESGEPTVPEADLDETGADEIEIDRPVETRFEEWPETEIGQLDEAPEPTPAPEPGEAAPADTIAIDYGDLDEELLELFLEEGQELLEHSDGLLQQWRENPTDRNLVTALQRDVHTIKGSARMAGLNAVGEVAHVLEDLLESIAGGQREATPARIDTLEAGCDHLHAMLDAVAERDPLPARGTRAMPDAEVATDEAFDEGAVQAAMPEDMARTGRASTIRLASEQVEELLNFAGEVSIFRSRIEQEIGGFRNNISEVEQTVARLREQLRKLEQETEAQILSRYEREHGASDSAFDPLELDRYSTIQQLSRALAESVSDLNSLTELMDDAGRQSETLLMQQARVNTELQEGLMQARMVSFNTLAPRLRRVVRNAARDIERKAELEIVLEGEGELDRNVLDRMTAPIEHILRNAVAHGIETPEARRSAGKPEAGTIRIEIDREATELLIRVSDDGSGLNLDRIRERALELDLLTPNQAEDPEQLSQVIFNTGFSTAAAVSELAGRGVGMDVVSSEVRQIGGRISVETTQGKGTRFTLRIPLSLAVMQAIFVEAGERLFSIPLQSVRGVAKIRAAEWQEALDSDGTFRYGGESFPLLELEPQLGFEPVEAEEGSLSLLMIATGDQRAAIRVTDIQGHREIVLKPVGPQISSIPGILGGTIMGDGQVVVILDMAPLIERALNEQRLPGTLGTAEAAPVEEEEVKRTPLVMVVDDSITMRRVSARILEHYGLEVITARDGVEAVDMLYERVPDIMLLDIEMPRMDGFELAAYVRDDARLQHVPIMMITSRSGDKHREHAKEIGVDRYLIKPYQEANMVRNVFEMLELPVPGE